MIKLQELVELIKAVTGWETGIWELLKLGEKGISMARAFNCVNGFNADEDKLPDRMFEAIESGPLKGQKISKKEFLKAKELYYEGMGWDVKKGMPSSGKLAELDLFWVENLLKDLRQKK